jgi:hypothetical protein
VKKVTVRQVQVDSGNVTRRGLFATILAAPVALAGRFTSHSKHVSGPRKELSAYLDEIIQKEAAVVSELKASLSSVSIRGVTMDDAIARHQSMVAQWPDAPAWPSLPKITKVYIEKSITPAGDKEIFYWVVNSVGINPDGTSQHFKMDWPRPEESACTPRRHHPLDNYLDDLQWAMPPDSRPLRLWVAA